MNDIPLSMLLSVLAFLLLLGAFFSASETGLMSLNRYRLQYLIKQKHTAASKAQQLLLRSELLLGFISLGLIFIIILTTTLVTIMVKHWWGDMAIPIALSALTLVIILFVVIIPKKLAALKPESIAFVAAHVFHPLLTVFYPFVWLNNKMANLLLRCCGLRVKSEQNAREEQAELRHLVTKSDNGLPDRYHKTILSILDLELATVEDIMTPRHEIVGIDLDAPLEDILQQIKQSPHTQLPAYKKNIDRVIGFFHTRTLLSLINQTHIDKQVLMDKVSKPLFIPESTSLYQQMQNFKAEKSRIGLVVDEYGDVKGLITLDDLLQDIVGELIVNEVNVKQHGDGSLTVDGGVTVREFNRITQSNLPIEGPKTINGLIIEYMEMIPAAGTSVNLYGYHLEIIECDENTVKLVRFHPKTKNT